MSRAVRVEFEGALYHVMCRGVARMPVFLTDKDRAQFVSGVGGLVEDGDLRVHDHAAVIDGALDSFEEIASIAVV